MEAIIPRYNHNGNDTEKVVYIEYQDGYPHSVYTMNDRGGVSWWDVFAELGDKQDMRIYNSGGGGCEVQHPHYHEKYKGGSYWKDDCVNFNGTPINATKIDKPLELETYAGKSINPFDVAEIVYSYTYCNVCERKYKGGDRTDYCDDHTYTDNNGDLRYFNHKYVQ